MRATAARRDGDEYVLQLDDGKELRGDRLLVATGRRPRVEGIGLETVGVAVDPRKGIAVDDHLRAGERLWAIGDVNGIWPLTHVGEYEGDVVAANIAGEDRPTNYEAVPRVTYTDPQAAAVGALEARYSGTAQLSEVPKTATYTHAYAESNGFLTLLSDGERLTGAYGLGPGGGRVAAAGDAGHPRPRPGGGAQRHHPALPELLRDLRRGRAVPGHGHQGHAPAEDADGRADGGQAEGDRVTAGREPELAGQTVALIGGSSGIGLETARRARTEGADVILVGRNKDRLDRAAQELGAQRTAAFDATDEDALAGFFRGLTSPIDHVMVTGGGPSYSPILQMDSDTVRLAAQQPRHADGGGRAERRRQGQARRHAAVHGRRR